MRTLLLQMFLAALMSGIIALALTPLVKRLAIRAGVVRTPRGRDVHSEPIPLWGGVAMLVAYAAAAFLAVRRH